MRALARRLAHWRGEWLIRKRRAEIIRELSDFLAQPVRLVNKGQRGHDSIYFVTGARGTLGVLRLANPFKARAKPPADAPYVSLDGTARIDHEWRCYQRLAAGGLSPRPLWRSTDALLCEYLPLRPMDEQLKQHPDQAWRYLSLATQAVARLHAQGITHMDASLANILADDSGARLYFIDFEYAPAAGITVKQQQAYDHLRLVESAWKFIPEGTREHYADWLAGLDAVLTDDRGSVELQALWPSLGRLHAQAALRAALIRLFNRHAPQADGA